MKLIPMSCLVLQHQSIAPRCEQMFFFALRHFGAKQSHFHLNSSNNQVYKQRFNDSKKKCSNACFFSCKKMSSNSFFTNGPPLKKFSRSSFFCTKKRPVGEHFLPESLTVVETLFVSLFGVDIFTFFTSIDMFSCCQFTLQH